MTTTLQSIATIYTNTAHNEDNFEVGGGLDASKFASRRHENARNDIGKLTLGEATRLFKMATSLDLDLVRDVIQHANPYMEWHHAGKLPKRYGGGMKKTYFLNAKEICNLANNWEALVENYKSRKEDIYTRRTNFLQQFAVRVLRTTTPNEYFYETDREMNGRNGWFTSYGKSYRLTEYISGYSFASIEIYNEFNNIKP